MSRALISLASRLPFHRPRVLQTDAERVPWLRRHYALLLILSIALVDCAASSGKPDDSLSRVRQSGVLRVAIDPSYPPFCFLDGSGEVAGFDADIAREVASRLGVKASFVGIEVTSILDALIARKADVGISAITLAPEYAKTIGFSRNYFNAGQVYVVRQSAGPAMVPSRLDAAELGVEIGSTGEVEGRKLAAAKPGITIDPFDSLEAALDALTAGRVDAVIADRVTASLLIQQQKGLRIAGEPFTDEPYVAAARGSDRTLLKEIDTILAAMAADGFLKGLERRWIEPG